MRSNNSKQIKSMRIKYILVLLLLSLCTSFCVVYAQDFPNFATDGRVYAFETKGDTAYLGGSFHYIGSVTGQAALLSATTGTYDANFPKIDGIVYATIPDGNGGWFIGGDFTEIAGIARSRIAHILSDNSVDPNWNPGANNRVLSFALTPDKKTLFVAGGFTTIAGNSVSNIAAISAVNGQMVSNWAISADYEIISISLLGNILYVGGGFANIGGLKRDGLAAINISTLTVNAWDPNKGGINPSGTYLINNVTAINKKVFIGGRFTSMNGVACSGSEKYLIV